MAYQVRKKKQPKHKVFGRDIPGTSGTQTSGYPGQKLYASGPFTVVLDREWPGCPGIWVGTSRIWKNFMQENFGLIFLGRTPKGAYSTRGRSRHLLETPFSEPLLRTLLRTLFYCKTHRRPPSQNPSENPFPRTLPRTFSEPLSERCVAVRPLRRAPYFRALL